MKAALLWLLLWLAMLLFRAVVAASCLCCSCVVGTCMEKRPSSVEAGREKRHFSIQDEIEYELDFFFEGELFCFCFCIFANFSKFKSFF